jgi:hypothetical protein
MLQVSGIGEQAQARQAAGEFGERVIGHARLRGIRQACQPRGTTSTAALPQ